MTRHGRFSLIAFACGVLNATSFLAAGPRNIVLMIGDDHGLELGCYGYTAIRTPSLDRLAASGTRFSNAFAAVSSCSPSRSTLYTGLYNHTNGQYGLAHGEHNFASLDNVQSLPAVLKKSGYRAAIIGKVHVKPQAVYPFDELPCPGGPRNVMKMAETARGFLAEKDSRPFLLVVGYVDPHRDFGNKGTYPGVKEVRYDPAKMVVPPFLPDTREAREELAEYCQSISRMDQGVGGVLDAIEQTHHRDDTLVIYLSDNGIPFPGAKTTLYEPGIHLPLLVSCPTQAKRGGVCNAMVSWVDITPTILDWAGVKAAKPMAGLLRQAQGGRSFLGVLDQADPPGWDTVFASHSLHGIAEYYPMRMIRTRQYKYILNLAHPLEFPLASDLWGSTTWQAVLQRGDQRYGQRTVAALLHRPAEELYDLQVDPNETHNLVGDPSAASVLADLRRQLRDWQTRTADPWLVKYKHE